MLRAQLQLKAQKNVRTLSNQNEWSKSESDTK